MSVLTGFHPSIQFTYETEPKNRRHFQMYSLFVKDNVLRHVFTGNLQKTDIYVHWNFLHQSSGNAAL